MLREIHQQPTVLKDTLGHYLRTGHFQDEICGPLRDWLRLAGGRILIAASGSSRHAGLAAEILFEEMSGIAVDVEYASEYCARPDISCGEAALIVISQSGETADTLAALRKARTADCRTLAITNVPTSTMAREADISFPTLAGKELAIPATKSFTGQLLNLYLLAILAAEVRGVMTHHEVETRLSELAMLPGIINAQLSQWEKQTRAVAERYGSVSSMLYLGRGIHYAIAREGALKLKESAYLHAEGYPGGELKHGPNALVSPQTPLVMLATVDHNDDGSVHRYGKTLQLMRDMRQQNASILAIANYGDKEIASLADAVIDVEAVREFLLPICEVIPLQFFAYWMAVERGVDVDSPRNLSKAVLVE
jgi:glucosamine--fructose-6-phosphate aminotransferase (isomerizing)